MRVHWYAALPAAAVVAAASPLAAQERDPGRELAARGAPAAFVNAVAAQVDAAGRAGLPVGPVMDKALEGWAKRVAAPRVMAALDQLRARLAAGRDAVHAAGMTQPPDAVVAGAAEALARGIGPDEVRVLVTRAPGADAAAAGLMVAASLHAQGLDRAASVRAVEDAYARALDPAQLYELPSVVAGLAGQGMRMGDLAQRIMQGGGLPLPPMAGGVNQGSGRPGQVPPGPGDNRSQGSGRQQKRQ